MAVLRTLLVWILVLAVPLQAGAAVTKAWCGDQHASGSGAGRAEPAAHAHHAHRSAQVHAHHHSAPHASDGAAAPADASPSGHAQAGNHRCSACASCCMFGVVPGTVLTVATTTAGATLFVAWVAKVDHFASDGPERPPRILLA